MSFPRLTSINIKGYRPFRDFTAEVGALEVMVGTNGSGKSSLFEFLRFLRNSVDREIPPGIIEGVTGRQVFHQPGSDEIIWALTVLNNNEVDTYQGKLEGTIGHTRLGEETLITEIEGKKSILKFNVIAMKNVVQTSSTKILDIYQWGVGKNNINYNSILAIRNYINSWRFYNSHNIAYDLLRKPAVIEQGPVLREDCSNISSVLLFMMTEHPSLFNDLQLYIRLVVPGFEALNVKPRGGPGEVMTFWTEKGVSSELSLADLSDGTLHMFCWVVLCLLPNPPALICIDEPDQGMHPRTLPLLASLFQKASERTQILLATHSSYFLTHFNFSEIAVMKKENGEVVFRKPNNSQVIRNLLDDFGTDELEYLHWSNQLEFFS